MQFSRIGTHTIRCIITEQEIADLGFSIEDILSNAERTQEFMNQIFDMAEEQFGMKFEMGVRTVRADFLPDHTVSLTFSENQAQQKVNGFVEHLLEYVNKMLGESKEKLAKLKELTGTEANETHESETADDVEDSARIVVLLQFSDMTTLCRYAKNLGACRIPDSALYKLKDVYYLFMEFTDFTESEVLSVSVITDEYAEALWVGMDRLAYMEEHGDLIIPEHALEQLAEL